jgi:hypothetical protein
MSVFGEVLSLPVVGVGSVVHVCGPLFVLGVAVVAAAEADSWLGY